MATVNKKKKKKGEEAEEQVLQFKKFHYSSYLLKGVIEKEVPISEMDLFSEPAMNNAYNICHNVQV